MPRFEQKVIRVQEWFALLPALPFLAGAMIGFISCCILGRVAATHFVFGDFVRFSNPIQPQSFFYTTASEILSHVSHTVPKEKTLIVVGGASYFRGLGQNRSEVWTLDLQRRLGPSHAVVNLGIDSASPTDFGGTMYEVFSKTYPTVDYVANTGSTETGEPDGGDVYRYLFWDAYYKHLLPEFVREFEPVQDLRRREMADASGLELHLGKWLDAQVYACDLWTFVGYNYLFTIWSSEPEVRDSPFKARREYTEKDRNDFPTIQRDLQASPEYRSRYEGFAHEAADNPPSPSGWAETNRRRLKMFPPRLRPNCFLVLVRGNPFFMQTLSDKGRMQFEEIFSTSATGMKEAGYSVVEFSPNTFTPDDFFDAGHYMASGGKKMAAGVAGAIDHHEALANTPAGPIEMRLTLPEARASGEYSILTLSSSKGPSEELVFEYSDHGAIRIGYAERPGKAIVWSPDFDAGPPSATHTLKASLSGLYSSGAGQLPDAAISAVTQLKRWALVEWDNEPLWGVPTRSAAEDLDTVSTRGFNGKITSADRLRPGEVVPEAIHFGGVRLLLKLSANSIGNSLPLAVTGRYGSGDTLFFHVTRDGGLFFGYDHWGSPVRQSPTVPFGFDRAHRIEFWLPGVIARRDGTLTVRVDDRTVWAEPVSVYVPKNGETYFGWNPIGSTACATELDFGTFTSVILPPP